MPQPLTKYLNARLKSLVAATIMSLLFAFGFGQIPKYNSNRAAPATVYLDFDGQTVRGTSWNWDSTIHAQPANLKPAAITEIFNRVAEDYRIFNINITTDSAVYAKAPAAKRIRIIVTPTSKWYGVAGGVSFVNSFTWGDGTPSWVFSEILQNNPKYIGEACSHEAGHTLGLQHQSTFDKACRLVAEYAEGKGNGEIGWAPIMGVSYYKNVTTWNVGTSIEGCHVIQNDMYIISHGLNKIGFRPDDHGNTMKTSTPITFHGNSYSANGIINNGPDVDVFKLVLARSGRLKTVATPSNVGPGDAGANLDLKISLLKGSGDTIGRYNSKMSLSAWLDTNLMAGTYYMVIDGVANQNLADYNSVGYYSLAGRFDAAMPVKKLTLKGTAEKNTHLISWSFESDEPVTSTLVEGSDNGLDFKTISPLPPTVLSYKAYPMGRGIKYYRIKMLTGQDNAPFYSNVISLQYATSSKVALMGNLIHNAALINVSGDYSYDVLDETGRLFQHGHLSDGMNTVTINYTGKGLLLMRVYSQTEQLMFKLIMQ